MDLQFQHNFVITFVLNWVVIVTTSFALLSLLNPLTTIPYYFMLHPKAKYDEIKRDGFRIGLVVLAILLVSLFVGNYILAFLGLQLAYFKIGGGVIIFLMALSMIKGEMSSIKINNTEKNKIKSDFVEKGLIVPLALPLTSGAGSIAYTIGLHEHGLLNGFIAVLIAGGITMISLMYSGRLKQLLGDIGMHLVTRIFGLFMIGIGIQIIVENLKQVL